MSRYQQQLSALVNYFKSGEKSPADFRVGMEIEHFILEEKSLKAVPYYGEQGIEGILNELAGSSWKPLYEAGKVIGLKGEKASISLEPGGQLELSILPQKTIGQVDRVYRDFLEELLPILRRGKKVMLAVGYQPESLIKDIPLLPKKRYQYMYQYFKTRGKYAHNMMKGTAAIQANLDYESEEDFKRKMQISYYLAPLIYAIFDNAPFFEGRLSRRTIRLVIWNNCDRDRCGLVEGVFAEDFGYASYAEYLLNRPAMIIEKGDRLVYVEKSLVKDIFEPGNDEEIEHLLSMVFPDVRLKKYIEIRMGDSLPYPYSLGYLAFWQGLLYNKRNLDILYGEAKSFTGRVMLEIRQKIERHGLKASFAGRPLFGKFKELLVMAGRGLRDEDKKYLTAIEEMVKAGLTPRQKTLNNLELGKKEALSWCQLKEG